MELKLLSKNLEFNSQAEAQVRKKLERLERHLKGITDATLELSRATTRSQGEQVVAQMTVKVNGYTLRGQETGPSLLAAIDALANVMDRQIQRFKGKVNRAAQGRRAARADMAGPNGASPLADDEPDDEGDEVFLEELGRVVRTKRFSIKPMSVEDAVLEMELLGHSFFLFQNGANDKYSVVYRRRDGDYGVIEPDLA